MSDDLTLLEKAALLSGASVWESRAVPRLGIRSLTLSDGPHGIRKQVGSSDHLGINGSMPATCFPTAATVANSWDVELAAQVGEALGAEAVSLGVDVVLGPGLNVKRSPLCGRNFEYFSEDPYLSGTLAAGYVRGIQSQGVSACPKHFAANSQELRRMASDSVLDERTLREIYLTAFEIVVREAQPLALMSAYNRVNGTYAHENAHLLQDVLRAEWGFDGAVVSDWGGSNDAVAAVRAGGTLEMPSPGLDSARQLLAAVDQGLLTEAEIDVRVAEMRALVARIDPVPGEVDPEAHHALARRVAEASQVLLKNEAATLPLAAGTRVAVIGDFAETPRYQGAGSSLVNPTRLTTALEALRASSLQVVAFARGFARTGGADAALVAEALDAAASADVALVYLGLDETAESEGNDRTHLRLADNQVALLAALRPVADRVVVVLSAGSVVEMPWLGHVDALLHGYLGGQAGAEATVNLLTGAVNPSGRLAETYPVRLEDTAGHAYYPGTQETAEYREGIFVGYRHTETAGVPTLFPFGFGLGYTTFAYADLVVDDAGATFTVENTGAIAGAEVAQLYVGRRGPSGVHRAARELKGFRKVRLEPGERVTVTIPFDRYTFRHFAVAQDAWQVEAGEFEVSVGSNVADRPLAAVLQVAGATLGDRRTDLPSYDAATVTAVPDAEFAALLGRVPAPAAPAGPLGANSPLLAMHGARSPVARLGAKVLAGLIARSMRKGKPDLNLLFLYNMPFRAMAKMTNGAMTTEMVESMVTVVNGRFFRGVGGLIAGYVRGRRSSRRLAAALARPSLRTTTTL